MHPFAFTDDSEKFDKEISVLYEEKKKRSTG